jgi:catechol 2,3-dioxygenase-like lactoylglutathione lyase family enzyme
MTHVKRTAVIVCNAIALLMVGVSGANGQPQRPLVTGISHLCVYAQDPAASRHFYVDLLGAGEGEDPQDAHGRRYYFGPQQFVEVLPLPTEHAMSRLACVAFRTVDAEGLRAYLLTHGTGNPSKIKTESDASRWFTVKDPEGNLIQFLQPGKASPMAADAKPIGTRIIHVGYAVHDRSAEDSFYRTELGFRPYWFGAMQADHVDWISQQVPDGVDWLEYMMVGPGSDVPLERLNANQLGVLNHFSLGVANMEQAMTKMIGEKRLSPRHDGPQMGRDGKWQANFYDPDGTRVELMEFQPSIEPCCSPFTATNPTK